jgi:protein-S-isoprenylcysteine O-methyltransferase Ste14
VLIVVNEGVIKREEKYLEKKFGDAYLQYKSKVRRWI